MKIYILLIVASTILLIAAIGFLLVVLRKRKRMEQNILQHQFALEISLKSLEGERKRLSQEIHDGIGPLLTLLNLHVHQIQESQESSKLTRQLDELLKRTIRETHDISANLSSVTLEQKGLKEALEEYCAIASGSSSMPIDFNCTLEQRLTSALELNLYRVTQELIHNAIKHSRADFIWVSLKKKEDQVILEVRDNGTGFSEQTEQERAARTQLGYANIQHRLSVIQGTVSVSAVQPQGCQIQINVPLLNKPINENSNSRRPLPVQEGSH